MGAPPNCHNQPLTSGRWTNTASLASMVTRRCLALSLNLVILMNTLNVPGVRCKPTSGITLEQLSNTPIPITISSSSVRLVDNIQHPALIPQHESLLVDLLNKQQSEFISKFNRADSLGVAEQTGSGVINQPQQTKHQVLQSNWVPMKQQQQQQQVGESRAKASRQPRAQPCDRKRKAVGRKQELAVAGSRNVNNIVSNSTSGKDQSKSNESDDDDEEEDDDENDDDDETKRRLERKPSSESLEGHESVSLESTLMPAPPSYRTNRYEGDGRYDRASSNNINNSNVGESNDDDDDEGPSSVPGGGSSSDSDTPPDEAAARREQEAAEASEAEAADRTALAEQQAAQREIILAQAQSEAKAIREQQEALLRQQQLQQQILMRRHQNILDEADPTIASEKKRRAGGGGDKKREQPLPRGSSSNARSLSAAVAHRRQLSSPRQRLSDGSRGGQSASTGDHRHRHNSDSYHERGLRAQGSSNQQHQAEHQRGDNPPPFNLMDNQFSDQPDDNGVVDRAQLSLLSSRASGNGNLATQLQDGHRAPGDDELGGEDSIRQPRYLESQSDESALEAALAQTADNLSIGARLNLTTSDLLAAAQHHHYGAHYGSLGGHHKGGSGGGGQYYQYAESHKKGQFDSGFKRGNKKFGISGHSSQHKGYAEGNMKWHGKKGKGSHYWDYKHKNKKHYGAGDGYGGGHHYY